MESGVRQRAPDAAGHLDLHLLVQGLQQALAVAGVEGRALLNGEVVGGQVGRLVLQRLREVAAHAVHGLPRDPVDQVEAEVVEARFPDASQGLARLIGAVDPAQEPQQLGVEALRPDADAVHAATAVVPEAGGVHRTGVGFQRDLHPLVESEKPGGFVEHRADAGSAKGGGGAAAEEHRPDAPVGPCLRLVIVAQLPHQRPGIFFLGNPGGHVRVEVAVGALADAVGDVHVQ